MRKANVPVTHRSRRIAEVDLESAHGPNDGDDRLDSVAVDHSFVLFALFLRVPRLMNDSREREREV